MNSKNREILLELLQDADDFATLKKRYAASVGKVFRLFDRFDMLDPYSTPIAIDFEKRSMQLLGFKTLKYYVLSKEDIIVSKLGIYSNKDQEDIEALIKDCNIELLNHLIQSVMDREDFSERVKCEFIQNSKLLREKYNV
ncbi:DUF6036 family nucleotidyltransferase [Fusibacter sp. 3D3]|uniref:DUF6036 family nucleotidyltransferase n=1 Tax=Fusibacter sp. 3D3 TaxID=1048380 RepID=UPI00085854E2|nr:DUF6036 family nucleotidyltransferase [Fusibacter sp. 3D3]GAU76036.1 hypothetical protein F3D3_0632 [Fusibacter sp. 3D3]